MFFIALLLFIIRTDILIWILVVKLIIYFYVDPGNPTPRKPLVTDHRVNVNIVEVDGVHRYASTFF